jgi:ABC-type tungstate transport system permease subunit
MFKDTTPIYRIAASVKSIIPKHWIDFETVLKNKIENIDLDKDTLYYIIYNHYSKYIYGKSFVQSDLQEQLLTKIIGGVPHSHSWYNANYGYGYDRIIECIQKNTKTRNLIAKHIRDIKKHTLHIIANFSDIFINVYTHNVILNNRIKTAEAAVAAYINQI